MPVTKESFTTAEQVANHIVKHLLTQNERSQNEFGACIYQYEDVDGSVYSCAVGCLIDRYYYDESLEDRGVEDHEVLQAIQMSHPDLEITSDLVKYMHTMQSIHDNLEPEDWNVLFTDQKTGDMVIPEVSDHEKLKRAYVELCYMQMDPAMDL